MRRTLTAFAVLTLLAAVAPIARADAGTWSGEVLDLACYVPQDAKGEDHAGCAKKCAKGGQPIGLLAEDGTVVLLAADHKDGAPFEALKDWAGEMVEISGELTERDGVKVVKVTSSKAAG